MDTNKKYIQNWFKSSDYDIVTARAMLKTGRCLYVIFMCHLAVEKFLKGIVAKKFNKIPPKTHDLYLLLKLSGVQIPKEHHKIVSHLNEASIPTRYPEDISKISKQYNRKSATGYLTETEKLLRWLRRIIE
jgi:HEPN domain-containing protein